MTRQLRLSLVSLVGFGLLFAAGVHAGTVQVSTDPFSNAGSQHMTEVEPQIFANGSTIVAVFQQGRIFGGGSSDIGFATSLDGGATWQQGSLPGLTIWVGGSRYQSVSDPSLSYNAAFGLWEVVSLPVGNGNREVFLSRSADGLNWDDPITVYQAFSGSFDKTWISCDNWPTSPFFGNCYIEWDDVGSGGVILMTTSSDGGASWGTPVATAGRASGLGGQPLAQPSGRVVVPYANFGGNIRAFFSDDGGNSWGAPVIVANVNEHNVAGGIRDADLPSAAIDGDGALYVVWGDCRFRTACHSNDIVITSSADGETWSQVARIPIDDVASNADHFLPGLGADRNSFSPNVGLAIVFYYYPQANCSASTCQLTVGFITSSDGGQSWTDPVDVGGPMLVNWIASTSSGRMVGDYFSAFYTDDGVPHPIFGAATPPLGMLFQSMFSTCGDCPSAASGETQIAGSNEEAAPAVEEWQAGAAQSPSGALRVSAEAYRVNIGTILPLSASGPAAESGAVNWEIEEGAAGGSVSGGVYTAPLSPGIYHLVARAGAERARLAIKVFTVL
jgi:hypothetical protein